MRSCLKLGAQILLLPAALIASDGGIRSSSMKGSSEEDRTGDAMSPAMRRIFEEARAEAEAEIAEQADQSGGSVAPDESIGSDV